MEFETITKVAVARLRLDRLNPRLIGEDDRCCRSHYFVGDFSVYS